MNTSLISRAGPVEIAGSPMYHDENFGYTLYEEVIDPASPEGPRAIGMHVPANSMSKVWELVEPGYSERVELLQGSASLVVGNPKTEEWTTIPLTPDDPTGDNTEILTGQAFCVVTGEEEAFVLSRPSKPFRLSFEKSLTSHPDDELSRLVLSRLVSKD